MPLPSWCSRRGGSGRSWAARRASRPGSLPHPERLLWERPWSQFRWSSAGVSRRCGFSSEGVVDAERDLVEVRVVELVALQLAADRPVAREVELAADAVRGVGRVVVADDVLEVVARALVEVPRVEAGVREQRELFADR